MSYLEHSQKLYFTGGSFCVNLSRDFFHNCITKEPFTHTHPRYEFHYVRKGSIRFASDVTEIVCPEGSVLIIPPHISHVIHPCVSYAETYTFLFEADIGYVTDAVKSALCPNSVLVIADTVSALTRLDRVQALLKENGATYADMIRGELTLLFAELATSVSPKVIENPKEYSENRIGQIDAYLCDNYFSPTCSCEELAGKMGLSTRQVYRMCIAYYGVPFRTMLCRMRMEIARHRLQNSDCSITELSESLGYSSPASFSAAYKKFFGHAPTSVT